jgi:hypothetical protein
MTAVVEKLTRIESAEFVYEEPQGLYLKVHIHDQDGLSAVIAFSPDEAAQLMEGFGIEHVPSLRGNLLWLQVEGRLVHSAGWKIAKEFYGPRELGR